MAELFKKLITQFIKNKQETTPKQDNTTESSNNETPADIDFLAKLLAEAKTPEDVDVLVNEILKAMGKHKNLRPLEEIIEELGKIDPKAQSKLFYDIAQTLCQEIYKNSVLKNIVIELSKQTAALEKKLTLKLFLNESITFLDQLYKLIHLEIFIGQFFYIQLMPIIIILLLITNCISLLVLKRKKLYNK